MPREYYSSPKKHDVVFLGDCEFYESINPVVLWNSYGINSYVRGSSQQLIWDSYYYLLETLEYEKPGTVVFNAVEMKIGTVQKEEYTRLTLDGLKLSKYKLAAAKLSIEMNPDGNESLISYIFPILRYHSRWSDISEEDFKYLFSRDEITYAGYFLKTGTQARSETNVRGGLPTKFPDICWEYLDKIVDLCKERDIEIIIYKSPTDTRHYPWYDEWDEELENYSSGKGIMYISSVSDPEGTGIDWNTDTCDGGDHLNYSGAEKVSLYLGRILSEKSGVPDRRGDEELDAYWEALTERYNAALAAADAGE